MARSASGKLIIHLNDASSPPVEEYRVAGRWSFYLKLRTTLRALKTTPACGHLSTGGELARDGIAEHREQTVTPTKVGDHCPAGLYLPLPRHFVPPLRLAKGILDCNGNEKSAPNGALHCSLLSAICSLNKTRPVHLRVPLPIKKRPNGRFLILFNNHYGRGVIVLVGNGQVYDRIRSGQFL